MRPSASSRFQPDLLQPRVVGVHDPPVGEAGHQVAGLGDPDDGGEPMLALPELGFGSLPLRHVPDEGVEPDLLREREADAHLDIDDPAVLAPVAGLEAVGPERLDAPHPGGDLGGGLDHVDLRHLHPEEFLPGVAGEGAEGPVDVDEGALPVHGDEPVDGGL